MMRSWTEVFILVLLDKQRALSDKR